MAGSTTRRPGGGTLVVALLVISAPTAFPTALSTSRLLRMTMRVTPPRSASSPRDSLHVGKVHAAATGPTSSSSTAALRTATRAKLAL
jgi:hypothetical protein